MIEMWPRDDAINPGFIEKQKQQVTMNHHELVLVTVYIKHTTQRVTHLNVQHRTT